MRLMNPKELYDWRKQTEQSFKAVTNLFVLWFSDRHVAIPRRANLRYWTFGSRSSTTP